MRAGLWSIGLLVWLLAWTGAAPAAAQGAYLQRLPQDEIIYFVLADRFDDADRRNNRGGLRGGRLATGFDPAHKGFFHGGDFAGLIGRLDYIQGLGATALWLAPIFRNKPVQGPPGQESAGYHGYWVTDFTDVDPHFGTRAQFRALVEGAHARGMKVYIDIITNHTADVIQYAECPAARCAYRSRADYPYTTRGGPDGAPINPGFAGDALRSADNFARLTDPAYAYSPFVPPAEASVKKPAWLNDPIYYHNRGDSTFYGESSLDGDFFGLDDLFTEHPRVLDGLVEIYGAWIDDFGVDGFRIDTARHVNPEFWRAFCAAMLERARARGIANFHIFGEVADPDPAALARHTRVDGLPSVLDFAFQDAVRAMLAQDQGADRLARVFAADALYEGGAAAALRAPTFIGNHDMGRFAHFALAAQPQISDEDLYARVRLAHAVMLFSRGVPVIYYGDEQGFTGDGGDQDAREDMFATAVAVYADNRIVGARAPAGADHFDVQAPLYRAIADLAAARAATPALRRGRLVMRAYGPGPGLGSFSRLYEGAEALVAFNTGAEAVSAHVVVDSASLRWRSLVGACAPEVSAQGSYRVDVAPRDLIVCVSEAAP